MHRGEIVIRAKEIEDEIASGKSDKPFKTIMYCNIGNPQQLGQHPVTYFRQVLALCDYPEVSPPQHCIACAYRPASSVCMHAKGHRNRILYRLLRHASVLAHSLGTMLLSALPS